MKYKGFTIYTKQYSSGAWEAGMRSKRHCNGARTFSGPMFDTRDIAIVATKAAIDRTIDYCTSNAERRTHYKHA